MRVCGNVPKLHTIAYKWGISSAVSYSKVYHRLSGLIGVNTSTMGRDIDIGDAVTSHTMPVFRDPNSQSGKWARTVFRVCETDL